MVKSKDYIVEIINKETCPDDFLARIGTHETNMLLDMLKDLAITRADLDAMDAEKMQAFPERTQAVIEALKIAVANPKEILPITAELQEQQLLTPEAAAEFIRVSTAMATTGKAEHQKLKPSFAAYGDEEKLENYKAPGGKLFKRMTERGYTFFLLKDKEGNLLAMASGNAGKLASGEASDITRNQFRLLNMAVPAKAQGQGYGTILLENVRSYAAAAGYEHIAMPLSLNALVKENPFKYAAMAQTLHMNIPKVVGHVDDPLSIEMQLSTERLMARKVESRRQENMSCAIMELR